MAKRKGRDDKDRDDKGRDDKDRYDKDRDYKNHDDEDEPPKHRPEGREHQVHKEILERRMKGGREPTQKDYSDALEQWKNLPGSVVRPPTDITPPAEGSTKPPETDQDTDAGVEEEKP